MAGYETLLIFSGRLASETFNEAWNTNTCLAVDQNRTVAVRGSVNRIEGPSCPFSPRMYGVYIWLPYVHRPPCIVAKGSTNMKI